MSNDINEKLFGAPYAPEPIVTGEFDPFNGVGILFPTGLSGCYVLESSYDPTSLNSWVSGHQESIDYHKMEPGCGVRLTSCLRKDEKTNLATLGGIFIDDVDGTFVGLTVGRHFLDNMFSAGSYFKFQEENFPVLNRNIFANEISCPLQSAGQADCSGIKLPIKRYSMLYHDHRADPNEESEWPINHLDVALLALPKEEFLDSFGFGARIGKYTWWQKNLVINEPIIDISPECSGVRESGLFKPSNSGIPENISTKFANPIGVINIHDPDNYRKYQVWMSGEDSRYFEIALPAVDWKGHREEDPYLYLKPNVLIDFEKKNSYDFHICAHDYNAVSRTGIAIDKHPFSSRDETIYYTNCNLPICSAIHIDVINQNDVYPITCTPIVTTIFENFDNYMSGLHVANINTFDIDPIEQAGYNVLSLRGIDQPYFALVPGGFDMPDPVPDEFYDPGWGRTIDVSGVNTYELWLKPQKNPYNYEAKRYYGVTIELEDYSKLDTVGKFAVNYQLRIKDVNECFFDAFVVDIVDTVVEQAYYIDNAIAPTLWPIKVAEVYWLETDYDVRGSLRVEISGVDADYFYTATNKGPIYLKEGVIFDYETKPEFNIELIIYDELLNIDDPSAPYYCPPVIKPYKLVVTATNDPSYEMIQKQYIYSLPEHTTYAFDLVIADYTFLDQDNTNNMLLLVGPNQENFYIKGNTLYLRKDAVLDFEYINKYEFTVYAYNQYLRGSIPLQQNITINIEDNNIDEGYVSPPSPPQEQSINVSAFFTETPERVEPLDQDLAVANIEPTDIEWPYEYHIHGPDAEYFRIKDNILYLKAGTRLDYVLQRRYSILVGLEKYGWDISASRYTLDLTPINYHATKISLLGARTFIEENTDTSIDSIPLGVIYYIDDNLGSNNVYLTGQDSVFFHIQDNILYLNQGVNLDYEQKPFYVVDIVVSDPNAVNAATSNIFYRYILYVQDINENPIGLVMLNSIATLKESVSTKDPILVGRFTWFDPDIDILYLWGNKIELYGPDARFFTAIERDTFYELYLNANTILDHDIKPVLEITICVLDDTLEANYPVCLDYNLIILPDDKPARIGPLVMKDGQGKIIPPLTKINSTDGSDYINKRYLSTLVLYSHKGDPWTGSEPGTWTIYQNNFTPNYAIFEIEEIDTHTINLSIVPFGNVNFWNRSCINCKIEWKPTDPLSTFPTLVYDYYVDVQQPFYPFASTEEIDRLDKDTRVWFVGGTSGFVGGNECPLVIRYMNYKGFYALPRPPYYYNNAMPSVLFDDLILFGWKNYDWENIEPKFAVDLPIVVGDGDEGALLLADIDGVVKVIGLIFSNNLASRWANSKELFGVKIDKSVGIACRADKIVETMRIRQSTKANDPFYSTRYIEDPTFHHDSTQSFTDPTKWKFLFYDKLTHASSRNKLGQEYIQVGTYFVPPVNLDPGSDPVGPPDDGGGGEDPEVPPDDGGGEPGV